MKMDKENLFIGIAAAVPTIIPATESGSVRKRAAEIQADSFFIDSYFDLQKYIKYLFCILPKEFKYFQKPLTLFLMKDFGLLLLRVGFGLIMIIGHGYPKLMKIINGNMEFANPIGIGQAPTLILATLAEFVFPILVIIGFKTRLSTIPTALTMAAAFFIFHASDPFSGSKE